MKLFPKAIQKAARDSVVGSIIGVISFCIAIVLLYVFLWVVGYSYNVEKHITMIAVAAAIITAIGTTANAYRERKQRKKEQTQKIITENRHRWLEQTRLAMANLNAAEKNCINLAMKKDDTAQPFVNDINGYVSQVILYLPYEEDVLCDEIRCLANDVKAVNGSTDKDVLSGLLCRIRVQENKFRKILKTVWEDIKNEAHYD